MSTLSKPQYPQQYQKARTKTLVRSRCDIMDQVPEVLDGKQLKMNVSMLSTFATLAGPTQAVIDANRGHTEY